MSQQKTIIHKDSVVNLLKSRITTDEDNNAFYVADLGELTRQLEKWNTLLPRVEPFYAVKCNPDQKILNKLTTLGTGFDCASMAEIEMILNQGVAPEKIIYANPCKQASHIRFAASKGVRMMTFDNIDELYKIKENHPNPQLIVRILTDDSRSLCKLGAKFGVKLQDLSSLLKTAQQLGLEVIGVSYHVGSGCFDASAFGDAVILAHRAFKIAEHIGIKLSILDIGGGFPGNRNDDNNEKNLITFEKITEILRPLLDFYFPAEMGIQIIGEPGRYFASSVYTLATNVIARRNNNNTNYTPMYYINDGIYGSFNCIMFDHVIITPRILQRAGQFIDNTSDIDLYKSSIWGPTCDSIDCIGKDFMLPVLEVGDWIYFECMGAYTVAAASEFNGMQKSHIVYTDTS